MKLCYIDLYEMKTSVHKKLEKRIKNKFNPSLHSRNLKTGISHREHASKRNVEVN